MANRNAPKFEHSSIEFLESDSRLVNSETGRARQDDFYKEQLIQTSIFLAKLIGPMMVVMGLTMLINPTRIRKMAEEFLESEALIFLSGMLTLPAGLAIVITHNVWSMEWTVIITLLGWVMVFAGVARMTMPGAMQTIGSAMLDRSSYLPIPGALWVLLGAYLAYRGYIGVDWFM